MKKLTFEDFIIKATKIHGEKYNYSKSIYVNNRVKMNIICPIHGNFLQKPNSHLNGDGCKNCGSFSRKFKLTFSTDKFIEKSNVIHNNLYDYSKVNYINNHTNIINKLFIALMIN